MSSLVKHRLPNDTTVVWNKQAPWTVEHGGKVISKHAREELALKKAKAFDKHAKPTARPMGELMAEEERRQASANATRELLTVARDAMQRARERTGVDFLGHDVAQGVWRTVLVIPCKGRRPLVLQMSRNADVPNHLHYLMHVDVDMVQRCLFAHAADAGRTENESKAIADALRSIGA